MLDALKIDKAHVVGLSMGAFATLHFGMHYPGAARCRSRFAGGGYGAHPAQYGKFQADAQATREPIRDKGMAHFAATYGHGPTRMQFRNKDPRGFAEFIAAARRAFRAGSANTMLGYQARRPSLYDLTEEM